MSSLFLNKESSFILLERFFSIKNESHDLKPLSEIFHALQNENFADFINEDIDKGLKLSLNFEFPYQYFEISA